MKTVPMKTTISTSPKTPSASLATAHGLPRPALVGAALRLMGNLTDGRDGDGIDRAVAALTRLTPTV